MENKTTILIADDSESIRLALSKTLRDAGFHVDEACDGKEALKKAKKVDYDLIITDVKMPKISGLELIGTLRKLRQYKTIPILSLTNLNTQGFITELKKVGATGWIQKPFGRAGLLKTLNQLSFPV